MTAPATTRKGFADLPDTVKAEALKYEARGLCTRDRYASIYFKPGYKTGAGA
jgi:hypothetical protein